MLPSYQDYCLSSVPNTVLSLFGCKTSRPTIPRGAIQADGEQQNVVLFVADGLGYFDVKEQLRDGKLFQAAEANGSLLPITTVFPSTTAAALTTISTGLTPQEHCLPEWFVYMKEVEKVIVTLQFSAVGEKGRDSLLGQMSPRSLFSGPTINPALRRKGVDVVCFVSGGLVRTVYSKLSHASSEMVPYITSSDLFASLRRRIEKARRPTFFYVYWSDVDTIGHAYGPATDESASEVSLLSHLVKTELVDRLSAAAAKRTTLILTADHGQIRVDPKSVTYLNKLTPVVRSLQTSPSGRRIPPWGSARDMYLAVVDERLSQVRSYLAGELGRKAVVLRTKEGIDARLFGINKPRPKFLDRVGNLMVLPRKRNLVWYRYSREDRFDLRGHHGGMHPREMLIPLVVSMVSGLR